MECCTIPYPLHGPGVRLVRDGIDQTISRNLQASSWFGLNVKPLALDFLALSFGSLTMPVNTSRSHLLYLHAIPIPDIGMYHHDMIIRLDDGI